MYESKPIIYAEKIGSYRGVKYKYSTELSCSSVLKTVKNYIKKVISYTSYLVMVHSLYFYLYEDQAKNKLPGLFFVLSVMHILLFHL